MMEACSALLTVALHHSIREPNIDAGFERFSALTNQPIEYGAFCEVVAACLRERLIREPIRLPEGALQCHWQLELTSDGVSQARRLVGGQHNSSVHWPISVGL
jgi:hypothetical protein